MHGVAIGIPCLEIFAGYSHGDSTGFTSLQVYLLIAAESLLWSFGIGSPTELGLYCLCTIQFACVLHFGGDSHRFVVHLDAGL